MTSSNQKTGNRRVDRDLQTVLTTTDNEYSSFVVLKLDLLLSSIEPVLSRSVALAVESTERSSIVSKFLVSLDLPESGLSREKSVRIRSFEDKGNRN